jgi:hypothetical protein
MRVKERVKLIGEIENKKTELCREFGFVNSIIEKI